MDNRVGGKKIGHCVICGAPGKSENDFICSDCGDPLCATLYCASCHRRLNLDARSATAFLADYNYNIEDTCGLIIKVDRCGECMKLDETANIEIYRLSFPVKTARS